MWVDHGSEFYNKNFKDFLKDNEIDMYLTYNEGKSVVAERFIKTLKNKIYKRMTSVGKNVYFDVLDDIVDKYNNTYQSSIKMKPKNVTEGNICILILLLNMLKNPIKKILSLTQVIMSEFQSTRMFFLRLYTKLE